MTRLLCMILLAPLQAVDEALEMQDDEFSAYLNRRTSELVVLSHAELREAEAVLTSEELAEYPQWQREAIEKSGKFLPTWIISSHEGSPICMAGR